MQDSPSNGESAAHEEADDLNRRLARYRKRLQAEGRVNSIKALDNSIGPPRGFSKPGRRPES